ncbi:MAG: hypothetical protein DRI99_00015 [Candidatus Aminicenantes bacterium]|nr:MAG: hypothetical protein DRJ11_00610 [Candidatus Aminicenantes bacterium]RLE06316.1 MAG: hypothetical protein DRI99_00015 [Candidatus Aminicenantes bacterium]HHF42664.1 hypothetical protein [Candidatus Aminicenantes bacterium]
MLKAKIIKYFWLLPSLVVITFGCAGYNYVKLRLELPAKATVDLDKYSEIRLVNFIIKKQPKGVDLNKEIRDYFQFELSKQIDQKVAQLDLEINNEEALKDKNFWKSQAPGEKTLFFTGSVEYKEEVRKALLRKEKRQFEDPFSSSPKLAERRFYSLLLDLYLIDSITGEVIYHRQFKETQFYQNKNQTAYFALFDLMQKLKLKLFRRLLGGQRIQERYLIR